MTELSAIVDSATLGSAILAKTAADAELKGLLELMGPRPPSWATVYDIIEYLEDATAISKAGLAPKKEVVRMRWTAAYYRHPGNPKRHKLPEDPPTLAEATAFAKGIVKKWLHDRIGVDSGSG